MYPSICGHFYKLLCKVTLHLFRSKLCLQPRQILREGIKQDHTSNNNLESTKRSDKVWRENVDKWSGKEAVVMPNIEDHESN